MDPSFTYPPVSSLANIPADVLCQIALFTVSLTRDTPTPRDLNTLPSLLLTCRLFYGELAMKNNSDLYAKLFQLMFDIGPVKRRLGTGAVTSSSLSSELKERVEVLNVLRTCFSPSSSQPGHWETIFPAFNRAVVMMIENEGKNRHQLLEVAYATGVPELLEQRQITGDSTPNLDLAMFVVLTELGRPEAELLKEPSNRRYTVIDLLHPFVLSESWSNTSNVDPVQRSAQVAIVKYFGCRCRFRPASLTLLARLCTVARYKATKKIYESESGRTTNLSSTPISSTNFHDDWSWYVTLDHPPLATGGIERQRIHGYTLCTFNGVWEGQLFIPSAIPQKFTCAVPMQAVLREFVSTCTEETLSLEGREDDDGEELARGWFPTGVEIKDNTTSIKLYDPVKTRWITYQSSSHLVKNSDKIPVVFDTVLIGNTSQAHGEIYGEYTFHGRVRPSGRISIVRNPVDPRMVDLGIWVFHGQLHVGAEFIGDWRNTSTTKHTPAGQGWFQLSKISGYSKRQPFR